MYRVLLVFSLALVGCSSSNGVSGTVTYEGDPVASGSITFTPADGVGPVVGATITNGEYEVADIAPGRKIVQIVGVKDLQLPKSSAEMAAAAQAGSAGEQSADEIPPDAIGNNQEVMIPFEGDSLDFHLKKPAS